MSKFKNVTDIVCIQLCTKRYFYVENCCEHAFNKARKVFIDGFEISNYLDTKMNLKSELNGK